MAPTGRNVVYLKQDCDYGKCCYYIQTFFNPGRINSSQLSSYYCRHKIVKGAHSLSKVNSIRNPEKQKQNLLQILDQNWVLINNAKQVGHTSSLNKQMPKTFSKYDRKKFADNNLSYHIKL